MQLEKMTRKHYDYVKRQFGIDEERGKRFDELIDELTWKECDASDELAEKGEYSEDSVCAIELVDIICGPYDPEEINEGSEED